MSFSENLLDGFDTLAKKTTVSLEGVKGMGSLFLHLSETVKDFASKTQSVCSKFKGKKLGSVEGTVKAALVAAVTEVETTIVAPHNTLADQLLQISKETDAFLKDRDQSRKRMLADAANMKKEWDNQLSLLKKAKEAYHKAAKDAVAAQAAANKAAEKAAAAASAKLSQANDKARAADDKYKETLAQANEKQKQYYTVDQPALLLQFQQWEEERLGFIRDQLTTFGKHAEAAQMPSKWQDFVASVTSCAASIDVKADIDSYIASARTNVSVPDAIAYEPSPDGGPSSSTSASSFTVSSPAPLSTSSSGASSSAPKAMSRPVKPERPEPVQEAAPAAAAEEVDDGAAEEGAWHKVLYDYEPANDGELGVKENEQVFITEKDTSGWWYARNKSGKEGFVPASYVVPN